MDLFHDMMMQPLWVQIWIGWLGAINIAAVFFLNRPEARWVLAALFTAAVIMSGVHTVFGYQRILGLGHVLAWTPLLIYLLRRRRKWGRDRLPGKWIAAVFTTDLISLAIDYADVIRFTLGERL
jgi:hypothetical protein